MDNDIADEGIMGRMTQMKTGGRAAAAASLLALALAFGGTLPAAAQTISVGRILVEGTQRVDAETVKSYMTVKEGATVDAAAVNASLKALYESGLFADVRVEPRGADLVVSVRENPAINAVSFDGNERIDDKALSAVVQSAPRSVYTKARAEADAQAIAEAYRKAGRPAASVTPRVTALDQNRVDLAFDVVEGAKAEVKSINFEGNAAFSDSRLRDVIATRETTWWRFFSTVDFYDADRSEYDRELLRRFYMSNGYADVEISPAAAQEAQNGGYNLTYTITEGPIYRFGPISVDASATQGVDPALLQGAILTREGETFSAEQIEKTISDMTYKLGENGYAFTKIEPKLNRDAAAGTVGVSYVVAEGPKVYVERIDISGNSRTLDRVIRREFELSEGDAFNTVQLQRSRSNIRALGFFKNVAIQTRQGSAPDRIIVDTQVEEASTGSLQFGLGFSSSENISGEISLTERNLLGRGQYLRLRGRLSTQRTLLDMSFTEPQFLGYDVAAGFDAYHTDIDNTKSSSYSTRNTGFRPRLSFPVGRYATISPRYQISRDQVRDVPSTASPFIQRDIGSEWTSSIGYSASYDRRNDKVEPTSGYILRMDEDLAGLGGDTRYLRSRVSAKGYMPVWGDDVVASLEVEGGAIMGFGGYDVRTPNRFFLGGDSFRGFSPGGMGPSHGGDSLGGNYFAIARGELTFPIGLPKDYGVSGGVFADVGSLWGVDNPTIGAATVDDSAKMRASVGASVFWVSPFGPIRLNFAKPISKESTDDEEMFRITAGTRF